MAPESSLAPFVLNKVGIHPNSAVWELRDIQTTINKAKKTAHQYVNHRGHLRIKYVTAEGYLVSNSNHDDQFWIIRKRGHIQYISLHANVDDVMKRWPPLEK